MDVTTNLTAQIGTWANASLASPAITEQVDNWTSGGDGGGFGVATGGKAAAGAYSATTATLVTAARKAAMSFALQGASSGGGGATAPTLATFESVWNTITTPKTVIVTGCLVGDRLVTLAGGDQSSGNTVSAVTSSTTVGATSAWTEVVENLDATGNADWYHGATATVTTAGDITVQVDRTKAGATGGMWGFAVVRARGASAVNLLGQQATSSSAQTVTGTVSDQSAVVTAFFDWNATNPAPTAWTPTGQTVIESASVADYTVASAYWNAQAAGSRAYGTTAWGSSFLKGFAVEITGTGGAAPSVPPRLFMARPR